MLTVASPVKVRTIVGFILPKKDIKPKCDDDDSETEEEENEPEFLDAAEIDSLSFGGQVISASRLRRAEVDVQDVRTGEKCRVEGRFPLIDPWWEVTCRMRRGKRKLLLQGAPSYALRRCPPKEARSILSLFLTACGAAPEHVSRLLGWLPPGRSLGLAELLQTLGEIEEGEGELKVVANQIKHHVLNSDAGKCMQAAILYPQAMYYLPTLLPRQFYGLIQKWGSSPKENGGPLAKLEELIQTDVWKLGFKNLLQKEAGLLRCEAGLAAFRECGLWDRIPPKKQDALRLNLLLRTHVRRNGSTCVDRKKLPTLRYGRLEPMGDVRLWDAVRFLQDLGVVVVEPCTVALADIHAYETGIAESLRHLVAGEHWCMQMDVREVLRKGLGKRDWAESEPDSCPDDGNPEMAEQGPCPSDGGPELDPDQVHAAQMICENPVTVVSGKGGCGKTTVVSIVFGAALKQQRRLEDREVLDACRDFENDTGGSQSWDVPPTQPPSQGGTTQHSGETVEVLLAAPTGRAAAILTQRTRFRAFTLHQVIWSFMNTEKDDCGAPKGWKFSAVRALVVDEGSLVSVQLLHSVLHMLRKHARLQKLVLLGDVRQLPSIEAGNTLHDLFHCLARVGWGIEMRTNHRAESQLIVRNAGLISERCSRLEFDAVVRMDSSPQAPAPEKSFIHIVLPDSDMTDYYLQEAVLMLLRSSPGLESDTSSQFIAFRRKHCELINELCCKHYSQHITRDHRKRFLFQIRDKVCCTRNGYVTDRTAERQTGGVPRDADCEEDKKNKEARERLCNGQIFFITADDTVIEGRAKRRYLTLDDRERRALCVWYRELQRECRLRHAWARTIHTFQGSEAETIVYVLGKGLKPECWKHVYTAITRGRRRVYVISTEAGLHRAVLQAEEKRLTRLGELAKRAFPQHMAQGEGLMSTQDHAPDLEEPTPTPTQSQTSTPTSTPILTPTPGPNQAPKPTQNLFFTMTQKPTQALNSIPTFAPRMSSTLTPTPTLFLSPPPPPSAGFTHSTPLPSHPSGTPMAEQDLDTSLQEDMAFSTTYTWSPMMDTDSPSAEEDDGNGAGEAGGSTGCRRERPDPSPDGGTPSKQPRLAPEESPLGSTQLQRLSLDGHNKARRQIFSSTPPEQ
ncbi:hypothetical protein GJAV_G00269130 [Gymnothorax javanicus]|nr:hypothetical protein GJAV_G00269130 [Gymnothorax javanicus]